MRNNLLMQTVLCGFLLTLPAFVSAQAPTPTPTPSPTINSSGGPNLPPKQPDAVSPSATPSTYVRPDAETRRKRFIKSMVGPLALGRRVTSAGVSTWKNSPEEWGTKWEGFGRRLASGFGKSAIKQTTKFGLDEAFKLDSHFYRSKSSSVSGRVRNALISPVTARDRNGKRVVGVPNLVGTYASSVIAREAWYPNRYDWKDGVRSGTISLGFNAAFNLFKEFVWKK